MTNELKPCPRCGGEVELDCFQTFSWCNLYYRVRCTNEDCDEQMRRCECISDAIDEWNRRVKMELNREQIVKALECCASGMCFACPLLGKEKCVRLLAEKSRTLIRELSDKLKTAREDAVSEFYEKIYDVSYEGRHGTLVEVVSIEDILREMFNEGSKNDR